MPMVVNRCTILIYVCGSIEVTVFDVLSYIGHGVIMIWCSLNFNEFHGTTDVQQVAHGIQMMCCKSCNDTPSVVDGCCMTFNDLHGVGSKAKNSCTTR